MIDIKNTQGNILLSVSPNAGSLHRKKLMTEDYLLLKFSSDTSIQFEKGTYVEYNGLRYELVDFVFPTQNTSMGGYNYELRLDAYYWKWKNKILMYDRQGSNRETSWKLTRTPDSHLDVICSNLFSLGYTYNGKSFEYAIDDSVTMTAKLIEYNGMNIIDALTQIAQTWDAEWWVQDNIIHLGRCEYHTSLDFELDKNVESMSRSESNDDYATRLYVFGSTRNLPANYRENSGIVVEGVVQKRLMLPAGTPYIDAYKNMSPDEVVEAVVIFDDVYPRRVGTFSDVKTVEKIEKVENEDGSTTDKKWNAYRYKDTELNFSEKYRIPGKELRISFTSGALQGMDFGVVFNPEQKEESDPESQLWEIQRNEDYGMLLPEGALVPEDGNQYILYGFNTSLVADTYIPAAEKELKERAEKHILKCKEDPSVYDCRMNAVAVAEDDLNLNVGDRVRLLNPAYFDANGRQSRIYGFEKYLDGSQVSYTVGNTSKYSRLAQIENDIKEIIYQGNAYSGSGGGVYVIGRHDDTVASDRNVYSALRSALEYVSKKYDDVVRGIVTFVKGIRFGNFVKGSSGAGIYQDTDGNWHIEGDYGHFRKKLTASEVEIQKTSHIGGKQISTGAEMVCSGVEDYDTFWRCYFVKEDEDGNEIFNQFSEEDLAYVETFNLVKQANGYVGNHFYWRKVVGTGDDYIDLSKSICAAESDAPQVGDNIIQLGHAGTDTTRQGAIIQASAGLASPYYRIYSGIKSFTLPEPDVTLSPHGTKIKADSIILEATGEKLDTYLKDLVADVKAVKKQSDGMWVLWFSDDIPTAGNYPAIDWDTDEVRDLHLQDIAVIDNPSDDHNNGRAWRYHKSEDGLYSWTEITDKYLLDALNIAVEGRDTAKEKCRNFVIQPTDADEYEVGDTWSNATWMNADGTYLYDNDSLVATSGKGAGKPFSISHWRPVSKATSAFLEMLPEQILLGVAPSVEEAKGLAEQAKNNANDAYKEAAKALGLAEDVDGREKTNSKSISSLQLDMNEISASVGKIKFDANNNITSISTSGLVTTGDFNRLFSDKVKMDGSGNITNINKSGLLTTSEFNTLLTEKVKMDGSGNITNISKSGLITTGNFATQFTEAVNNNTNIVKRAEVSTFVKKDSAGNLESGIKMKADQIDFIGKTIINGNFKVGTNGDLTLNNITVNEGSYLGKFRIRGQSLVNEGFADDAHIIIRNDNKKVFAGIGASTLPATLGGTDALCRLENHRTSMGSGVNNIGLLASAKGATQSYPGYGMNYAIQVSAGTVDIPGVLFGARVYLANLNSEINLSKKYNMHHISRVVADPNTSEFTFYHNLGHSDFFVMVCAANDNTLYTAGYNITNTTFNTKVSGRNGVATWGAAFSFVAIGFNHKNNRQ